MEIEIHNLQKRVRISPRSIRRMARRVLSHEKVTGGRLSIAFVSDQRIKFLNKKYLHREYTTDVLAFDLAEEPAGGKARRKDLTGEIVISAPTAARNAKTFGTSVSRELNLYVIHGILHLLGYDDHSPNDVKRIRTKEQELLNVISRP